MQTINLIIPMAGLGKRFLDDNYTTYKTLLKIDHYETVYDKIISNFDYKNIQIILILNKTIYSKYKIKFKRKNVKIISIENHNNGPLYTLYMATTQINQLINNDERIFITYSDINWHWNFKKVLDYLKNKESCVFTHSGFHPHLEVNSKSDFCKIKNKNIIKISQKKTFSKDYKNDFLAIGCYYLKKKDYLNSYFQQINKFNKKKEYYILSLINFLIKKKINVTNYNINKFVHLGIPQQYEDFISWKKELLSKTNNYLSKNKPYKNNCCIMLMAGQGKRLKKINLKKFLLTYKKNKIFKHILNTYKSNKNIIITNKDLKKYIPQHKDTNLYFIRKNKSMFETIMDSSELLKKKDKYILTSCDCYGKFDFNSLNYSVKKSKADLCMFGFKFSNLQKKLNNAHTQLVTNNNNVVDIKVKADYKKNLLGHAGFFWVNSGKVFNHIPNFLSSSYYKSIKREIIIDDYFKFIINNNLIKATCIKLKNYVHIGSMSEYNEYQYWEKYFSK